MPHIIVTIMSPHPVLRPVLIMYSTYCSLPDRQSISQRCIQNVPIIPLQVVLWFSWGRRHFLSCWLLCLNTACTQQLFKLSRQGSRTARHKKSHNSLEDVLLWGYGCFDETSDSFTSYILHRLWPILYLLGMTSTLQYYLFLKAVAVQCTVLSTCSKFIAV